MKIEINEISINGEGSASRECANCGMTLMEGDEGICMTCYDGYIEDQIDEYWVDD